MFGECDEDIEVVALLFIFIIYFVLPLFCLVGIFVCMGLICWHASMREVIFATRNTPNTTAIATGENTISADGIITTSDNSIMGSGKK